MEQTPKETDVHQTLFEDGYFAKSLGNIADDPEYALTELVANAWDAGATKVELSIPKRNNGEIWISDNGIGLTTEEFENRWMTLGYNRITHQGRKVVFPPSEEIHSRYAYGRNGVGRHAMLCFADEYNVSTKHKDTLSLFKIKLSSGANPFVIASKEVKSETGYGTIIKAKVTKNIPDPQAMREVISARFIHDPQFTVCVNDEVLKLTEMPGVEEPIKTYIEGCGNIEVIVIDALKSAKTKQKQGFAFWVRNRLVGEPSWTLGNTTPIDARTKFGRRFTIVVKCDDDDIEPEIHSDWSGFKKGDKRTRLFDYLCRLAKEKYQTFSKEKIDDTKREALRENLSDIRTLNRTAKADVAQFVDSIVEHEPTVSSNFLSTAVQAVINLQQTRSGQRLLEKLSELPSDDIDALERILSEWSVQDALTVLDEIDRRIATVRAIEILGQKNDTDELHTLHPLVTESRWLFGPEFEASEYASNNSLKNAVNKVFKVDSKNENYQCSRKRPDLLIRPEFTISAVALEDIASESNLFEVSKVLLLELKKGNSQIGKKEIHQAEDYIDEIRNSGCIAGAFYTNSFVIGTTVDPKATMRKTLEDDGGNVHSSIRGVCYSTLTQTASRRLFQLKDKLQDRYSVSAPNNRSKILDELLDQQEFKL